MYKHNFGIDYQGKKINYNGYNIEDGENIKKGGIKPKTAAPIKNPSTKKKFVGKHVANKIPIENFEKIFVANDIEPKDYGNNNTEKNLKEKFPEIFNNNEKYTIDSCTELRLPKNLPDLSFDNKNNK